MGDIQEQTTDVTIVDEDTGYRAGVTSDGKLKVDASVSVTDTAIRDGVDPSLLATVIDTQETLLPDTANALLVRNVKFAGKRVYQATIQKSVPVGMVGGVNFGEFVLDVFLNGYMPPVLEPVYSLSGDRVLFLFRAVASNLTRVRVFAGVDTTATVIDDMDDVTDWASSGVTTISLDTTDYKQGTGSMSLDVSWGWSEGDVIYKDYATPVDFSQAETFRLWYKATRNSNRVRLVLGLSDGTNSIESPEFGASTSGVWELKDIDIQDFTETGPGTTDLTAITRVYFRITRATRNATVWIDDLKWYPPDETTVRVSVYYFGQNNNPSSTSEGTLLTLDNGQTFQETTIEGATMSLRSLACKTGIDSGDGLVPGDWYGISLEADRLSLFGMSGSVGEYPFYSVASDGTLSSLDSVLAAGIVGAPDSFVLNRIGITTDDDPGGTVFTGVVLDENNHIEDLLFERAVLSGREKECLCFEECIKRYDKTKKIVVGMVHDSSSPMREAFFHFDIVYTKEVIN